ncbi:MAG: hypothetical protein RLZ98_1508 [Pseudomonadota bacterium]|jgi:hypothetical protein
MMVRKAVGIFPALVLIFTAVGSSLALATEKRIALLIGNRSYDKSVGALQNPHKDVNLVADALKKQGFEILPHVFDATRTDILGAVRQLAARLRVAGPGAIGFFYYSGHGAAEKDSNTNYLIPVDAKEPGTVAFWDSSLRLDDVMRLLDSAPSAVKFVVFDACRNELQLPTRDTSKGLLPVAEQQGYFVAYASAPGRTASDLGKESGPYAAALSRELGRRGLDHLNLFQNVKEKVIETTGGAQYPWESNGLSRRVFLTGEPNIKADMALWEQVRLSNDVSRIQNYLDQYPDGLFAATAEQMKARLIAEAARREAAQKREAERRQLQARQAEELRHAVEEAQRARAAVAEAEAKRKAAEMAAQAASAARAELERTAKARVAAASKGIQDQEAASRSNAESAALASRLAIAAAEDSKKTLDALTAAEARFKAAEQRLAALEKYKTSFPPDIAVPSREIEPPPAPKGFDGWWVLRGSSNTCFYKKSFMRLNVTGRIAKIVKKSGNTSTAVEITAERFQFSIPSPRSARVRVVYSGRATGKGYRGTYRTSNGKCGGVFTVSRM